MENEPRYLRPEYRTGIAYLCVDGLIYETIGRRSDDALFIARARYGSRVRTEITPPTWQVHPESRNCTPQFTRSYE